MPVKPYGLAVKALVKDHDGKCLLIRRSRDSKHFAGKWDMPGGKVDEGEDIGVALCREVREETGLNVKIDKIIGVSEFEMKAVQVVILYFQARSRSGNVVLSSEHDEYQWVSWKQLVKVDISEQLIDFIRSFGK